MKVIYIGLIAITIIGLLFISGCQITEFGNKQKCTNSGGIWQSGWISPGGTQQGSCVCTGIGGKIDVNNQCVSLAGAGYVCCHDIRYGEGQNNPMPKQDCIGNNFQIVADNLC